MVKNDFFDHCIMQPAPASRAFPVFLMISTLIDSTGALQPQDVPEHLLIIGGGIIAGNGHDIRR
jgi:hypothetical protein